MFPLWHSELRMCQGSILGMSTCLGCGQKKKKQTNKQTKKQEYAWGFLFLLPLPSLDLEMVTPRGGTSEMEMQLNI